MPDPRLGEQVCAWIKLHQGEKATEEEIKDFCKGEVNFKISYCVFTLSRMSGLKAKALLTYTDWINTTQAFY